MTDEAARFPEAEQRIQESLTILKILGVPVGQHNRSPGISIADGMGSVLAAQLAHAAAM